MCCFVCFKKAKYKHNVYANVYDNDRQLPTVVARRKWDGDDADVYSQIAIKNLRILISSWKNV